MRLFVTGGTGFTGSRVIPLLLKNGYQSAGQLDRDFPQGERCPRARRTLDLEFLAVVIVELLKRLDDEIVQREPDRPAPIGIATE